MITPFEIPQLTQANALIEAAQRIVIFTHLAPDGDAMGSSLAIYHWMRHQSKEVRVVVPNAFPNFLAWIPGAEYILVYETHTAEAEAYIAEADLCLCLDFNDPKRIGPLGELVLQKSCPKILIDHHLYPADFATIVFSQPEAPATCALVYQFIAQTAQQRNLDLSKVLTTEIATCIYTGLMTDTGNFAFNSNDPTMYEMIAALIRAGINKDAIYNAVFNQYSEDRMRLMGYCLHQKMRIFPEYHAALIALSDKELKSFRFKSGDAEGIVNLPLQISDVYYSVLMRVEKKQVNGKWQSKIKISLRSQGDRPVNILASEVFFGGGHMNASGGEYHGSLTQAIEAFEKAIPHYLKKE